MAYIGLNDHEKLSLMGRFIADLTGEEDMAQCCSCGRRQRVTTRSDLNNGNCLHCNDDFHEVGPVKILEWMDTWQVLVKPILKPAYDTYDAIIDTPFDAWLDTSHNTITVMLEDGYRTYPVPCKSKWVFDIEGYIKRRIEGRRRKSTNRKGAVTAA